MWFSFGLVSLTVFSVYFTYKNIKLSWKGIVSKTDQTEYKFKLLRSKYRNSGALIGIDVNNGFDYVFKREKWFDRLCKRIGLVVEHQVGDDKFDDMVFILSDSTKLHDKLSDSPKLVSIISDIFSSANGYTFFVEQIRSSSGTLWVKLGSHSNVNEEDIYNLAPTLIPLLQQFFEETQTLSKFSQPLWKDPRSYISATLLGISTALAITGYIQIQRSALSDGYVVLDENLLIQHTIVIGTLILVLLTSVTLFSLKRSPRTHLVLFEVILIGGFGVFLTAYVELKHINQIRDTSKPHLYEVDVLDKKKFRSKNTRSYYLYVNDWLDDKKTRSIKVDYSTYSRASIGKKLVFLQHLGALGYRWIDGFKIKESESSRDEIIKSYCLSLQKRRMQNKISDGRYLPSIPEWCNKYLNKDQDSIDSLQALYKKQEYQKSKRE